MASLTGEVRAPGYRWLQLILGILCMAMIANLQYGWTLFVSPLDAKYHWGRAGIQVALLLTGGALVGIAWIITLSRTPWLFFMSAPRLAASVRVQFTGPASATRSNGLPICGGSPRV
jgi:hypothetical protein